MKKYNKELVDQVKSGELAILNDGSFEELKDLLEHCFPLDPALIGGGSKYYLKHSDTYWDSRSNTSLPYKSLKDFFLEEEFVLPEKWFVKYNNEKEFKTCVKWANELRRKENSFAVCMGGHEYPDCKTKYLTWDAKFFDVGYILSDDKVEITYEQFLKYVLKQEEKLKGKIIGYKVPYDLFKGRIKAGEIFSEYSNDKFVMYNKNHKTSGVATEIVETWEPIYEKEYKVGEWVVPLVEEGGKYGYHGRIVGKAYKIFKIHDGSVRIGKDDGNGHLLFNDVRRATEEEIEAAQPKLPKINCYDGKLDGDYIIYGNNCAKFQKRFFEILEGFHKEHPQFNNNFSNQNRTIKAIKLDSGVEITMEQIKEINDFIRRK